MLIILVFKGLFIALQSRKIIFTGKNSISVSPMLKNMYGSVGERGTYDLMMPSVLSCLFNSLLLLCFQHFSINRAISEKHVLSSKR